MKTGLARGTIGAPDGRTRTVNKTCMTYENTGSDFLRGFLGQLCCDFGPRTVPCLLGTRFRFQQWQGGGAL